MSLCMAYSTGPAVTERHRSHTRRDEVEVEVEVIPHFRRITSARSEKKECLARECAGVDEDEDVERMEWRHWGPIVKCSRCSITYLKRLKENHEMI